MIRFQLQIEHSTCIYLYEKLKWGNNKLEKWKPWTAEWLSLKTVFVDRQDHNLNLYSDKIVVSDLVSLIYKIVLQEREQWKLVWICR